MSLRTVHCRIKVECIRLRVKDIDFGQNQIIIRDGKGMKDRVTLLPEQIKLFCVSIWKVFPEFDQELPQHLLPVIFDTLFPFCRQFLIDIQFHVPYTSCVERSPYSEGLKNLSHPFLSIVFADFGTGFRPRGSACSG